VSHELNFKEGRASMFYVSDPAWHNLGTKLDKPATAAEAIKAAQLGYVVAKKPLRAVIHGRKQSEVPSHFATVRMDTEAVLGVVGSRYQIIQNKDAFQFFDALVGEGEAIYETAGALGKGERIWILARMPGYIKVRGEDIVNKYLLLSNSHDGSSLVRARLTPVRVVCSNTLSIALSGSEEEVRIRHTPSAVENLRQAHELLGLTNQLYNQLAVIFQKMSLKKISDRQLLNYVQTLVPDNDEAQFKTRSDNIRNKILELHEDGAGSHFSRGTVWGMYNAVTEYSDHLVHTNSPMKRLNSVWFGGGNRFKERAFVLAKEYVKN
jgi:phage/plasmid-like protein (TIGR03299 family)